MDYEGNTKKRKRSLIADFAGNTSSASAPASTLRGQFEVFLSFWRAETLKTSINLSYLIYHDLSDALYHSLEDAGIRTFFDSGKPHVGEEIGPAVLKAINESKIFIPIFSRGYASSARCLRELEQMVECHKTMGNKILPIFWDVKPSDVRYQMGSYEEAFSQLQQHFDEKIVQRWKEAVRKVEQIKGWELEKFGHARKLVTKVVSKVSLELKKLRICSADTAGSTSSASAPALGWKYEVFLSFRVKDSGGFTKFLYQYLDKAGICSFKEDDMLVGEEVGPVLLKAIQESTISIPIISRDYASSILCLRELEQMVECHKTMGHKILPIFFLVEPSDVRDQIGSYEEAFRQHQNHFDEKIVQGWKKALREVGQMTGWKFDGGTIELVRKVVSKVLLELKELRICSADTAGSTSSAFAPALGGKYEVFFSFRGEVTRSFTKFLSYLLDEAGIRNFWYDNELVGEEDVPAFLKAIQESTISIPIFSRDYASSIWCLRELEQMVKCHKTMGHKILPIFYDVELSDVRYQIGSYKEAFHQHQNHFDKKIVEGWKKALTEVGKMKGWELENETNGHEGELLKIVVSKVLLELKKKYMVVTDNLVGIDHHEEKMMGLLNVGSNDVCIVGIHGMGGIGKTTIAEVIYNKLSVCFECCCFLADVRETSQNNGLLILQNQLIYKIQKGSKDAANVDEGISMIKDAACRKKVLIVLDDVDEKSQFDKLAGKHNWFGSGSRIIVTTRNKDVLNLLEVDRTYEPPLMGFDHSLKLFSKNAFFRSDFPPEDYFDLSSKVAIITAGLPLALEIIGSFLFGKGKAVWEDTLMKLKEIPYDNVQKMLRISYEALDDKEQQIFLDIACFFSGVDKRLPFYMWDDCKFYPTNAVDVLCLRSLVKFGDDNMLRMHDQLRDLGRQIVREENFDQPGERSRLFIHEEALDMLVSQMGTSKVEAICVEAYDPFEVFTDEEFRELPNLRFLQVDYADLVGDFKHLLLNLRWLQWRKCPGKSTITNFHLKNLVILDLSNNNYLKDDWEDWSQIKMTKKLKVLNLSRCNGLTRTPDFSTFTTLEILILGMCPNLVEIDPSIRKLKNLRVLDISTDGSCLATAITKFPDDIGNLEKLEEINASHCFHLQELPSSIGRLSSLRILRLDTTGICSLPTSICGLSCLQTLDLYQCHQLQSLPELPPSLTSLRVTCRSMETFPSLSNLINLKELCFDVCVNLVEIPRDIGKLSKLETLTLSDCNNLVKIPTDIGKLSILETLYLWGTNISTLPAEIGALSRLKQLELHFCYNLQCILGLPSSLFKLCLRGCTSMESLPDLSNLKNLSELRLNATKLMEIQGLGKLELLMSLDILDCGSLKTLPDLSNLKKLQKFDSRHCKKLIEIQGFGKLELLASLNVSRCESLKRLPDLSNLKKLQTLDTSHCKKLIEIQGFGKLEMLTSLNISWCESLERLPNVSNLGMLKELKLLKCQNLAKVEGLGVMKSLEILDVSWCTSLERLDLSNLKNLKELRIRDCKNLTLQGLEELESLELLDMVGCKLIEKSPHLSNLKELIASETESEEEAEELEE